MKKNKDLEKFYQSVYIKGEEKHFTAFLTQGKAWSDPEEILKELSWKSKKVLDVGCGTGDFAHKAAKKGAHVLGIDYSMKAVSIARQKHKHKNLRYEKLDASNIYETYDVVVSIGTLEHMDNPFKMLKTLKSHLKPNGKIIVTNPNWTNPRGYILMTLLHLFNAPITLADLHYLTPIDHMKWAKQLNMKLKWRTFEKSWAHGEILIKDFERRIPNVLRDAKLPINKTGIKNLINWIDENVLPFDNSQPHSGAVGLYVYSKKGMRR